MSTPFPDPRRAGFDREGHPSQLGIDRYLYGEADEAARAAFDAHLTRCPACAATVEALRAEDAARPIPLPPAALRRPRGAPRRPALVRAAPWLAAAALALVAVRLAAIGGPDPEQPDVLRARGTDLAFVVHVHDGTSSRIATADGGGRVRAGDRARFEVAFGRDGYLLVAGMDDGGQIYAGFPQEAGAAAVYLAGSPVPRALPTAIEFDDSPGREHLFAMWCERPFGLDALRLAMSAALGVTAGPLPAPPGCELRRVDLDKAPTP